MTNILDQVAGNSSRARYGHLRPKTTGEFFALRLAHKLGDRAAGAHYVELGEGYSEENLLAAYSRTLASGSRTDLARSFHVELNRLNGRNGTNNVRKRLLAVRIERRAVAVAILTADHIEYAQVRQLSSSSDKAIGSAATFVERIIEKFPAESAALEVIPNGHEFQRSQMDRAIKQVLSGQSIAILEVTKREIFDAFGHPPLASRKELRETISTIWPVLTGGYGAPFVQDAVALGLYVQTERLFIN